MGAVSVMTRPYAVAPVLVTVTVLVPPQGSRVIVLTRPGGVVRGVVMSETVPTAVRQASVTEQP